MSSSNAGGTGLDFGILLNVAFGAFKTALHGHLATAGFDDLGGSFGYVLRTLETVPAGMSLKELSGILAITPQGALKIVEDMIAKGYLQRSPDPTDSRVKRLGVAPRGMALLKEARRFHVQFERELAGRFGATKVGNARQLLEALAGQTTIPAAIRMQLL